MADLTRVAYLSSNAMDVGSDAMLAAINEILAISQANNKRLGVTGALLFNRGFFGQILEGPTEAVEETFERIQNDERHCNIALLDAKPIETLSFADWSMGFVGSEAALGGAFQAGGHEQFDVTKLSGDQMFSTLHKLALERELSDTAD